MDIMGLAGAWVSAQAGEVQMAVAADLMRQDAAATRDSVTTLLQSADQSMNTLANVAAGIGTSVDTTA